jgi:predicted dehydrogenase
MAKCDVLWNRHDAYYKESPWRGEKEKEGGALYTLASHFIDLLIWWFGGVNDAVVMMDNKNHSNDIEDCGTAVLNFDSGVMGSIVWTTCVFEKNYEGSITIIGEKGTIKIGGKYLNKIDYWDVPSHPLPENLTFDDEPNRYTHYQGTSSNHDKVIKAMVAAVRGGVPEGEELYIGAEGTEGLKSVEAIEKIYG